MSFSAVVDLPYEHYEEPSPKHAEPSRWRKAVIVAAVACVPLVALCLAVLRWGDVRPAAAEQLTESELSQQLRTLFEERPDLAPVMPIIELPDSREHNPPAASSAASSATSSDSIGLTSQLWQRGEKAPSGRFDDLVPVVFMHGMGDAGNNPGMRRLCETASTMYPGLYVVCADVANGLASVTTPLAEQVEEFANFVRNDPRLADGFHAVGLSVGGLVVRGYIETQNEPPVRRFVSICAPQGGEGECPATSLFEMVCPLWRLAPYTARLAFADYWKDANDKSTYLERSRWLADINNERENKKDEYKQQLISLERYILVEAENDTTIVPRASESHGFYAWGARETIVPLVESEGYRGDFIGLKTLDEQGKLLLLSYEGDHLKFSGDWWQKTILPHLGPQP